MKNNKLIFSDLSKLKITKIKSWAIYFTYNNKHYMLKEIGECYYHDFSLYERVIDDNGFIKEVNWLCDGSIESIDECIRYRNNKHYRICRTNKHIDKKYFVEQLYNNGYIERNEEWWKN